MAQSAVEKARDSEDVHWVTLTQVGNGEGIVLPANLRSDHNLNRGDQLALVDDGDGDALTVVLPE